MSNVARDGAGCWGLGVGTRIADDRFLNPAPSTQTPGPTFSRSLLRVLALVLCVSVGCRGQDQQAGEIAGARRPPAALARDQRLQAAAAAQVEAPTDKQILFGDLHVHTTYSIDAFAFALPLFGGEGAHPPADACDFARYCAALDFFSLNDHAEGLTPERWQWTKESLRDCNARAGDPADPDLVAFVGWEWTQVGETPETHFGHKNVMFPGLADDELPVRPITALSDATMDRRPPAFVLRMLQMPGPLGFAGYADFFWWVERLASLANCPHGVDVRQLPADCRENAPLPDELFEKLEQWGFDYLVIPHGLSWGIHAPLGARLDNQLNRRMHDPARQRLIEIHSGHGGSEVYRPWGTIERDASGTPVCPAPTRDFLPCCWRAGEIVRQRCGDLPAAECAARVAEARRLVLEAATAPHLVLPDTHVADWLDCDQCRDCFKPAFNLRPGESAQYSLAISNVDAARNGDPLRFRWGFIGSSDNHQGRPGTGYKQYARRRMTDSRGLNSARAEAIVRRWIAPAQRDPRRAQAAAHDPRTFAALLDVDRESSFMYLGALVAAHSAGRDRQSIWDALARREVYGTSGPRILLWFDLLNGPDGVRPMGSEVTLATAPRFEVRAVGSLTQLPGCPAESHAGLPAERLANLCRGECYHPSDTRLRIAAIEVVRVRPQVAADEDVDTLIEDPWRRFECPPDPNGCRVTFADPDYPRDGRDTVYYVRALQEPTDAVNGANYRTEYDADGNALRTTPCYGGYRTPADDDCLAPVQERAWSSPIFVDQSSPPLSGGDTEGAAPLQPRAGPR